MKPSKATTGVVEVRPGQLWMWCFSVGDDGAWLLEPVTEDRRDRYVVWQPDIGVQFIRRGDKFIVISLDDQGPKELLSPMVTPPKPDRRWHVALFNSCLVWFDHDSFNHAELIGHV